MTVEGTASVAVIGGGPAGLIAAERLAGAGLAVTIYDHMPSFGRKLLMAGRGGLNLTHGEPLGRLLARYGQADLIRTAVEAFPPSSLVAWCEGLGQPVFVGSSGRVFPVSFKASPLLRALLARLTKLGVRFRPRHRFDGWDAQGKLRLAGPAGETLAAAPDATLLALGGASWKRLGSDGAWAERLAAEGLAVGPLRAANCGFHVAWSPIMRTRFAGTPLKRIALTHAGTTLRGEAVITAEGIEGGAVYALSAGLREAIERDGQAMLALDLRPDLTRETLALRLAAPRAKQSLATFLRKRAGLPPVAIGLMHEAFGPLGDADADELAGRIKSLPLALDAAFPIDRAISTAGGLALAELDPAFMLRCRPGVFAAGEMLDWDAPTGGYLLQASFATGTAAACGVIAWLERRKPPIATSSERPQPPESGSASQNETLFAAPED